MLSGRDIHGEKGFSLVEIIVVLVIVGILSAIVIGTFGSSKANALRSDAIVSARAYQGAIDNYRATSGSRIPPAIGQPDWPAGERGPQRTLESKERRFLNDIPDRVAGGSVVVAGAVSATALATIVYLPNLAANTYRLEVHVREQGVDVLACTMTDVTAECT